MTLKFVKSLRRNRCGVTRALRGSLVAGALLSLAACASYQTPGGPAVIGAMTTPSVADHYLLQPEAPMPAIVAFTRVQAPGYSSYSTTGTRRGAISVVGPKDLESEADAQEIRSWRDVRDLVRVTPILVPVSDDPVMALREAAATLRADILALYTMDTEFDVDDRDLGGLQVVTLGLAPVRTAVVRSTASIVYFDVRTGFCYGTAESSAEDDQLANAWTTSQAIDDCRRRVERTAFEGMLEEAEKVWIAIATSRAGS